MTRMVTRVIVSHGLQADVRWMGWRAGTVTPLLREELTSRKPHCSSVVKMMSSSAASTINTKPRPFSELPGPKAYPFVGTMMGRLSDLTDVVPFFRRRCQQYFPIYKEKMLGQDVVILVGVEGIEKFFRKEPKYPNRFSIPIWNDYREVSGEEYGIFTGQDEQWHRMRSVIDKPMLRIKEVKNYTAEINDVVTDFLDRLEKVRGKDSVVPNLEEEFFNWSLEAVGTVLYERRFGGLSDHRDPEMERFIKAVADMFQMTTELFLTPMWLVKRLRKKKYKKYLEAWDILFETAKSCVDKRMNEISLSMDKGDEAHGVLAYLLAQKSMSIPEVYANVTELMMAAVDTTSSSMLWCLYEISQQPDVQDKLYAEVKACVGETTAPAYEDLQNLPYMKAVIKEILRMYPAAGSISRITEEPIELYGYEIPAKSIVTVPAYAVSWLPQYFDDPDKFVPERWMKDRADRPNPFAYLPFGIGTRMCVGRRVAELEMHLLLPRLIQRFTIEPAFTEPVKIAQRLVLRPAKPIKVKLIKRHVD